MTKNYFTNEQIKALSKKSGIDISYLGYFHELKRLMNLAVETAIGEPIVHLWENEPNGDAVYSDNTQPKPSDAIPLYSVKELEN
ncbi:MAG: hypothetical protein CTY32_08355 [Methylotenera sp.]|nr:MAG: hypothetical protein CTY32_08355 [Methylotenera sp.]